MKDFLKIINEPFFKTDNFQVAIADIIISVVIILAAVIVFKFVKRFIRKMINKGQVEEGGAWSIFSIIKYFLWVIIIILILDIYGVKFSILLASVAALLVGVGLGIQQLFNDIASGILILIEKNILINDIVELEDGTVGKVVSIGIRTTKVNTRDDIITIIPNSYFVNNQIINWSHLSDLSRFRILVGVSYDSDVLLVRDILVKCAKENKRVSLDPKKPFVRLENFGDSSIDFLLFFWVKKEETFSVESLKSEIRFAIVEEFRKNGIKIPFPQRDLHFKSDERVRSKLIDG